MICDYSGRIVLKPIAYDEIKSIEFKEFSVTISRQASLGVLR